MINLILGIVLIFLSVVNAISAGMYLEDEKYGKFWLYALLALFVGATGGLNMFVAGGGL